MTEAAEKLKYRIGGMDCAACVTKIENAVGRLPGVGEVGVSLGAGTMTASAFRSWMLKMVIANPMQLAMVSAEPTSTLGAFCAFSAENCGESPTTTMPQNTRNARNSGVGA